MSFSIEVRFGRLRSACRKVIAAELRSYDLLSTPSRIRYEHSVAQVVDDGFPTYSCGHGVMLYEPCIKCERTLEDCVVYHREAIRRIRELLSTLNG
jgi:hypothetical protein